MLRIFCFAKAAADARLGSALGDRVMAEEGPEWVDADLLPHLRTWTGLDSAEPFTKWTALKKRPTSRCHIGRPASGPRGSDYAMAFKALSQVVLMAPEASETLAVVLLRDADATEDGRTGLRQAVADPRFAKLHVVLGIADKMREAWVLSGFDPCTEAEAARLRDLRGEIGFDPTREPQRLRSSDKTATRHPKTALALLTGGDTEREEPCWSATPLDQLRERGANCGLAAYLNELRERLVPLLEA